MNSDVVNKAVRNYEYSVAGRPFTFHELEDVSYYLSLDSKERNLIDWEYDEGKNQRLLMEYVQSNISSYPKHLLKLVDDFNVIDAADKSKIEIARDLLIDELSKHEFVVDFI
jgi:hypothetical protein